MGAIPVRLILLIGLAVLVLLGYILVGSLAIVLITALVAGTGGILLLPATLAVWAILLYPLWYFVNPHPLPLWIFGVSGTGSAPAVPYIIWDMVVTAYKLNDRDTQRQQAFAGLTSEVEIGGQPERAFVLMGMDESIPANTARSLDTPEQFSMAWTTFGGADLLGEADFGDGRTLKQAWSDALTDPVDATRQFWPTIAKYGLVYNLLIVRKVQASDDDGENPELDAIQDVVGSSFVEDDGTPIDLNELANAGNLFIIDMRIFESFTSSDPTRFTPGTYILLRRNSNTGDLEPFVIRVSGFEASDAQVYTPSDPAWIYAIQAAKASITTWGIWIGHVFHWHVVTAAMQMTMIQNLHQVHPVRQILGRQSDFLIGFDHFLLVNWEIAPPTSFATSKEFLELVDAYAATREFFDDDPRKRLEKLNLQAADFTSVGSLQDWDKYPIVRYALNVWDASETYVTNLVDILYTDSEIDDDQPMKDWIAASASSNIGNVDGLPDPVTKDDLIKILTSLIYRITVHGYGRLMQSANPAISFAGNFPPCLQRRAIPSPDTPFAFRAGTDQPQGTASLADFVPNTGTIGSYTKFLYTFAYSIPYSPFVPYEGIDAEPEHPFVGRPFPAPDDRADECNAVLQNFRSALIAAMADYADNVDGIEGPPAQLHQWPLNIET